VNQQQQVARCRNERQAGRLELIRLHIFRFSRWSTGTSPRCTILFWARNGALVIRPIQATISLEES